MREFVQSLVTTLEQASETRVDRPELVAHATLTGLMQHWPQHPLLSELGIPDLLERTLWLRQAEPGRWIKQRRIGLAKLAQLPN